MAIFKSVKLETLRPCDYVSHNCGGELTLDTSLEQDVEYINEMAKKLGLPETMSLVNKMVNVAREITDAHLAKDKEKYDKLPLAYFKQKTR